MNFFKTRLKIEFEELSKPLSEESDFLQEYLSFNQSSQQSMQLKKLASKIDFTEGEEFLFKVLLQIKEDIFKLQMQLKNENSLLELKQKSVVSGIHFDGFKLEEKLLESGKIYYARIELKEERIAFFIKAQDADCVSFEKIKSEDKILYDNFVVSMQRQMIMDLKRGKEDE